MNSISKIFTSAKGNCKQLLKEFKHSLSETQTYFGYLKNFEP